MIPHEKEENINPVIKIVNDDGFKPEISSNPITIKTEKLAYPGQLLRPIHEDDPILKRVSRVYDFDNPEFMHPISLGRTLILCMQSYGGVGLSAIQIGLPVRAFSVGYQDQNQVFFNPEIIATGTERDKMKEGCISFPFCVAIVERATHIKLKWQNEEGKYQEGDFSGYTARIIQHELDHLDGITIRDKVAKLSWKLIKARSVGLYKKAMKQEAKKINAVR